MTVELFGLTAGAAKRIREIDDWHRQRLPDTGRRKRRTWPQSGRLVLMKSAETTNILGPRHVAYSGLSGGYAISTGSGWLVNPLDYSWDEDNSYDVDASYIGDHLVFPHDATYPLAPHQVFWARHVGGVYLAVCGGTSAFLGAVDSSVSGDNYLVDPAYAGGPIICKSIWSDALEDGQEVLVQMVSNVPTITHVNCPEIAAS